MRAGATHRITGTDDSAVMNILKTKTNKTMILKKKLTAFLLAATFYIYIITQFIACNGTSADDRGTGWVAPDETDGKNSPITVNAEVEAKGGKLYDQYCRTCHGETGLG